MKHRSKNESYRRFDSRHSWFSGFLIFLPIVIHSCASTVHAQSPASTSTSTPSPTATPIVFSTQTLADLKRLQQAALNSDYAYRQVAHLANNIGPRLSGSAQAAKAVEYVAGELKAIGCEVQLEKVMVPHWV
ncbi:MAG: hypothetical protein DMF17_11170, partial [Verrucomicrobia bacterium]